jgi:hypothetical protein
MRLLPLKEFVEHGARSVAVDRAGRQFLDFAASYRPHSAIEPVSARAPSKRTHESSRLSLAHRGSLGRAQTDVLAHDRTSSLAAPIGELDSLAEAEGRF